MVVVVSSSSSCRRQARGSHDTILASTVPGRRQPVLEMDRGAADDEFATVPDEGSTFPLHAAVYERVQCDSNAHRPAVRLYSCPNGSGALSSLLRAYTGSVAMDDAPLLRGELAEYTGLGRA